MNNDRVAQSSIVPVRQCLQKIMDMWDVFERMEPSMATNTEEIVAQRAAFYGILFVCIRIPSKKEEYKLSELRIFFEVHLWFACMEQNGVFKAVLCMCTNYNNGLIHYSGSGNPTSKSKMTIS